MALSQPFPSAASRGLSERHAWRAVIYAGVGAAGVLALFFLAHSYGGILHDERLYVGYALAALHPDSIGQDMILADDAQSGFTVFPAILVLMVEMFGSSLGAKLTALAGLVLWFGCAAALAASIAQGRTKWVILVFLAVLPGAYGGYAVFSFAEALAVPRPFAEAFVLLALALFASGRKFAAVAPLLLAALFHPIMALPGFAVWGWLILFDPRTRVTQPLLGFACVVLAAAGLMAAAALGAPMADRLFTIIDPAWREILIARTPYLFVSHWPFADWARFVVQLATVAIAASLVGANVRALFIAVAIVATGGMLVSLAFGDWLGSVLVVQVQPWRATWLLSVFAAAGLALCAMSLWRQGSAARVALAVLILAWIENDLPLVAILAACLALALTFLRRPEADFRRVSMVIWAVVAFCAALSLGMHLYAFGILVSSMPEGRGALGLVRTLQLLAIPICTLTVLWALAKPDTRIIAAIAAVSVALVISAFLLWDDRTDWRVARDRFGPDPALAKILVMRDGAVLWVGGGFATWSQAGRPNWASWLQGSSNVFSRKLAVVWSERARLLTDLGMVDQSMRGPFSVKGPTNGEEPSLINLSDAGLERLCARPDAPAWLIVPADAFEDGEVSATRWSPTSWTAPAREVSLSWRDGEAAWMGTRDFAVLSCHP